MRIGITCHPSAGGSGVLAAELGIALAKRGHTIHFVAPESPFRLAEYYDNVFSHAVSTVMYPLFQQPPGALTLAAKIAEVAEEFGVDIWHAHYAIPNASSAILAREMLPPEKRFPIVTTLHGTDITLVGTDPSFYRVTLHAMRNSDAVTAVSEWLKQETEREFAIDRPVRVIHNFLDPGRFKPEPARRCRLADPDEKIVMHVSNFRPVKRVTDVIRAFKRILDRVPARLIMIGDGPERLSAVGVARQLGIADRIKYLGNQERIETVIPCANVVLQPSEHESFGLVALEAMACEVPVIGTDSGGVREVVEHGITGYLCEVGDIDAMAGYAIALCENPRRAREMGRQGRLRVQERFSQDQIVPLYEALYTDLAG